MNHSSHNVISLVSKYTAEEVPLLNVIYFKSCPIKMNGFSSLNSNLTEVGGCLRYTLGHVMLTIYVRSTWKQLDDKQTNKQTKLNLNKNENKSENLDIISSKQIYFFPENFIWNEYK